MPASGLFGHSRKITQTDILAETWAGQPSLPCSREAACHGVGDAQAVSDAGEGRVHSGGRHKDAGVGDIEIVQLFLVSICRTLQMGIR